MNKVIDVKLISQTVSKDSMGVIVTSETKTSYVGNFASVSAKEFFRGGELGIKPEFIIKLWEKEYNGEVHIEVNGQRYIIYRSYVTDEGRVELYCQKDVGA